jgi:enterochelin esterase-like enzyme
MRQASSKQYFLVGVLLASLVFTACKAYPPELLPTSTPDIFLTPASEPSQTPVSTKPVPAPSQTPEPQACNQSGQIVETSISSQVLKDEVPVNIYLPPCYGSETGTLYPVLYLLHGLYSDQNQWEELGIVQAADALLATGDIASFLIVMPYISQPNFNALELNQAFFRDELMPHIEKNYPVLAEKNGRAIGGISRGASWAMRLGLMPDLPFGRIGAHSLPPLSGEVEKWVTQLAALSPEDRPLLFLDIGNNDRDLILAREFELELTKQAIPHVWYMFAGHHNAAYWREHLPIYLEWYTQEWPAHSEN